MLKEFVEKKHCKFAQSAKDWRDAIRMSCEVLEADGTVEENYKEDIIRCVEEYGPYIVIMPDVAMPHSQECAKGVHKTAIALIPGILRRMQHCFLPLHPVIPVSIWIICPDWRN